MRLTSLQLEHFRSYDRLTANLSGSAVHVFVGPNGAGKTNILEAISLLSLSKAAELDNEDLMQWTQDYYRVQASLVSDTEEALALEVGSQRMPTRKKVCRRNGVTVPAKTFVGLLPVMYFRPQDLDLFRGSPQRRRSFLDTLLCQVSPAYTNHLLQYQRLLKQRNTLLRRINEGQATEVELAVWDVPLAEAGAAITIARLELLAILESTLIAELETLGEVWPEARLHYERSTQAHDEVLLAGELRAFLTERRPVDIRQQSTTVGPHRDDWQLTVGRRNLPQFASRGQERTALLALLFLAVSFLELKRGERPVILLDDVFSELDDRHQTALLSSLQNHQVFITATHLPPELKTAQVWHVQPGGVKPHKPHTVRTPKLTVKAP